MKKEHSTSWETVESWYSSIVGEDGHYYHQSIIIPNALKLLNITATSDLSILDLGCGQGVFARSLPKNVTYVGIDASPSLIQRAKQLTKAPNREFISADVTLALPIKKRDFDCAVFIMSLQNMENGEKAIKEASSHLKKGGRLLIILNHPCFRIPRQSSWGIDDENQLQYRKINRYMSPMKIPIQMHQKNIKDPVTTFSFHYPISTYMRYLTDNHLATTNIEEWCSDKKSSGAKAKMEDRARNEIPLFLAILSFQRS